MPENSHPDAGTARIPAAVTQREDQEQVIVLEEHTVQFVVFLLAERYYAFDGVCIKEIVIAREIAYVPGMPDDILGIMNVRGEIESVLDLRNVLGLPTAPITKRSRIMIGEVHDIRSGLLVDAVEDVLEMPEAQISRPVKSLNSAHVECVVGETFYQGHELIILDLGEIFEKLLSD